MATTDQSNEISQLFKVMGDPFRVRLLLLIAEQEACVCHLECLLGKRQAYISQHLMYLRGAGLVSTRREGKYVFYSVTDHEVLGLIFRAAEIAGLMKDESLGNAEKGGLSSCACPQCGDAQLVSIKP